MVIDFDPFKVFINELENYLKSSIFFDSKNFNKSLEDIVREINKLENSRIHDTISSWNELYTKIYLGYITPYGDNSGIGYMIVIGPFDKAENGIGMGVYKFKDTNTLGIVVSTYKFLSDCGLFSSNICRIFNKAKCKNIVVYSDPIHSALGISGASGTGYRIYIDAPIDNWKTNYKEILEIFRLLSRDGPITDRFLYYTQEYNMNCKIEKS